MLVDWSSTLAPSCSMWSYTAISRKVVGKSARDNPERYCGRFWVHCSSKKFETMAREAIDVCLQMLKESSNRRFDSCSVRSSVLIIPHVTFRDCRVHIFSDNLSRNSSDGGNPLHGHPLNTDTRVERTVSIVPKKCSYLFSEINPLNTGYLRTTYGWISYLRKPKRKTESCHITFSPSGWVAMNALWQSKLRSRIPLSCFKERILVWDWQMIASLLQNKLVTVTEKKWSDVFP